MSDGIHARLHPMQTASSNPHFDRFVGKPKPYQLPPPHDPVLPLSKCGDIPIIPTSPRKPL